MLMMTVSYKFNEEGLATPHIINYYCFLNVKRFHDS